MNRRGFLGLLAATPIVAVSVPALVSLIERPHRWMGDEDICAVCRATAEEVVDGRAPRSCEGTPRRIFLPARTHEADLAVSWQRYTYQTYALGFAITQDPLEDGGYRMSGLMTAAQYRKEIAARLNEVFSPRYSSSDPEWVKVFGPR